MIARIGALFIFGFVVLCLMTVMLLGIAAVVAYPNLPTLELLTDYHPKIPLRIYSAEGFLLGEFGDERRTVVRIDDVPAELKQAILAAEDERFYEHSGVDYIGVLRAAYSNFTSGETRQGASTITMQVARNFFLSKEKTLTRKFNEALLSFKIEANLTKDEILELYINQIYLGQRAYGFAVAAQTYYGKSLQQLSLAEIAMLAGLPKAPSRFNPVANPIRARQRQQYVLRRMRDLGFIGVEQFQTADIDAPAVRTQAAEKAVQSDYFTEMVRQAVYDRYREEAYSRGLHVFTTLIKSHQDAAHSSLRKGLLDYDRRHGYRGPEAFVSLAPRANEDALEDALQDYSEVEGLFPAIVGEASPQSVKAYRKGGETVELSGDALRFAQAALGDKVPLDQRIRRGSIVRLLKDDKGRWQIAQIPEVEGALVSIDPVDGRILALVGGFDFDRSKFNHVTQALRQPGSAFKPFIYSAALEKGFTAATVINDAPLRFEAGQTGSEAWEPKNYDGSFDGPMRLRTALAKSKNLVSVRIMQAIGPKYAQDYIARFGFEPKLNPPFLTLALGAGAVTPMQMAVGYSAFANGGFRVEPNYITRIVDDRGKVLEESHPTRAGAGAERIIDPRNAFLMTSLMQDVIRYGTATKAKSLGRTDLAGKTGTTNDFIDAWFAGYQSSLVAVAWIGFDTPRTLGKGETGGQAALPIWMGYMSKALKGVPESKLVPPPGVVTAKINPESGLRDAGPTGTLAEYFFQEFVPAEQTLIPANVPGGSAPAEEVRNQLF
jgi:penicillin-binding protein 1A